MDSISDGEELRQRHENFAKLSTGALFNLLYRGAWFVAVKKNSANDQEWEVIELTKDNLQKIVVGQACETTQLHFDNMFCLVIHSNG